VKTIKKVFFVVALFVILFCFCRNGQAKTFEATAYCPCVRCCGKSDGITATGTKAMEGRTAAVDKSLLGKTLLVYVDNVLYGIYVAEDTGGAIGKTDIDIFFDSHKRALTFGRKKVDVVVVDAKG